MTEKVRCSTFLSTKVLNSPPQVDPCSFATDQTVQALLKEAEEQFTSRFSRHFRWLTSSFFDDLYTAQGDRKRALASLRSTQTQKTHHFSTFRTGTALGLAIPAFVDGVVRSTFSTFLSYGY